MTVVAAVTSIGSATAATREAAAELIGFAAILASSTSTHASPANDKIRAEFATLEVATDEDEDDEDEDDEDEEDDEDSGGGSAEELDASPPDELVASGRLESSPLSPVSAGASVGGDAGPRELVVVEPLPPPRLLVSRML